MLFASLSDLTKPGIAAVLLGVVILAAALAFFAFSPPAEASGYGPYHISKPPMTYWHPAPYPHHVRYIVPIHVVRPVKIVHPVIVRHPMPYSSASAAAYSNASAQAGGAHASASTASSAYASAY